MVRWVQSCLDANGGHFQHMSSHFLHNESSADSGLLQRKGFGPRQGQLHNWKEEVLERFTWQEGNWQVASPTAKQSVL
jgi:hypothetical protein